MNTNNRILEAYARRELDEPLHKASIKKGNDVLLGGHGRMLTFEDGSLIVELYTEGKLPERWHNFKPGEPVFPSALPVLEAVTEHGDQLVMAGANPSYFCSSDPGFSRVRFNPFEVEIRDSHPVSYIPRIEGLVTPFKMDVANSNSVVRDENPMFGSEDHPRWLSVELDHAHVGLRKDGSGLHWLAFATEKGGTADVVRYAEAFLTALSFVVGESVSWLAFTTYSGSSEITRLRQPKPKRGSILPPPIPFQPLQETETQLLADATRFFHDEANSRVGHLLTLCWDALGGYCHTEYLVVCSVVEALCGTFRPLPQGC